jgi:predicted SprT family Zn-dependent metalloprotease
MPEAITPTEYRAFQKAYDFFNRELFSGGLPEVLVTLQRRAHSYGYFAPERFTGRVQETRVGELALNPDKFTGKTDEEILGTMVHEMAHVWQEAHGTPATRGYHDREWAAKMKEIGLQPSSTGQPGGKETGKRMSDYIIAGGHYQEAYRKLAAGGFQLHWQSPPHGQEARPSKTKFTCPICRQNAWAKPAAKLACGACSEDSGELIRLLVAGEPSMKPELIPPNHTHSRAA